MNRLLCLACLAAPIGCAATAGNSSYGNLQVDYDRSRASSISSADGNTNTTTDVASATAGPVLERASFVRAVLRQNPSIESARQGWRAALARVHGAGVFEDPMVDLGVAPLSIGSSNARFWWEAGISQKLPWFGKRSLEAAAAAAEAEAARNDFEGTRRELALTAVELYDEYFVAVRSLEINSHHVESMRVMQGGATAQFESGRGSAQDPLQAETELAHMEHDSAILASRRDIVVAQMNELLHRDPAASLPPPPQELPLPPEPEKSDPKRLQEDVVSKRPDIRALHDRARGQQARADRAGRDGYPDVTLSTSYNSMWDMPEHRWMVGVGFSLPIQTGARTGMQEEATAMRAQFESEASRLTDSARTQVYVSLKRLEESKHVLDLFDRRLLPLARDQIEAARASFTASRSPFAAVVEAEKNLRSAELDYQMARAEYDKRHAELERALGLVPGLDGKELDR